MKKAKEMIEGSEIAQYARLRDYANEILKTNSGSTTFYRVGWDIHKRILWGQLLTAIGQDANNHIYPIAYAVVESENKESWKWFLEILQEDVGDFQANGFNFMSDMQKGLIPAVQEIYPNANHRFCTMHIWQNFRKKWNDLQLKMCMWYCAKATTTQDFNAAMERLKRINAGTWEYLDKISPKQWSRAHFSEYPKLDNYTNNNCEVFNAKVKKMRSKPIITMLEEVRCYVMRIMARNKKVLVGYSGRLAPTQQSRLEREKRENNKWRPLPTEDDAGNVTRKEWCLFFSNITFI
ncbi:uncharacterized protein [Arachis hypogaea]|uniref:uncharacterized protein n=1 Tax=Arachis hypogaea TaxID=3818 RepID=UPI003B21CF6F